MEEVGGEVKILKMMKRKLKDGELKEIDVYTKVCFAHFISVPFPVPAWTVPTSSVPVNGLLVWWPRGADWRTSDLLLLLTPPQPGLWL